MGLTILTHNPSYSKISGDCSPPHCWFHKIISIRAEDNENVFIKIYTIVCLSKYECFDHFVKSVFSKTFQSLEVRSILRWTS